jgi:hypothetical protein
MLPESPVGIPRSLQPSDLSSYARQQGEQATLSYVQDALASQGIDTVDFAPYVSPTGQINWPGVSQMAVQSLGMPPGCVPPLTVNGSSAKTYALTCGVEVAGQWIASEAGIPISWATWTNPDGSINWVGVGESTAQAILTYELGAGVSVDFLNPDGTINWTTLCGDVGSVAGVAACSAIGVTAIAAPLCGLVGKYIGEGLYYAGQWIAGEVGQLESALESFAADVINVFESPPAPPQATDQPLTYTLAMQGAAIWWQKNQPAYVQSALLYRSLSLLFGSLVGSMQQYRQALFGSSDFVQTIWMLQEFGAVFPPGWTEQLGRTGQGGGFPVVSQQNPNALGGTILTTEIDFFQSWVTQITPSASVPYDDVGFCAQHLLPYGLWTPYFPLSGQMDPYQIATQHHAGPQNFLPKPERALMMTMYLADVEATSPEPGDVVSIVQTNGNVLVTDPARLGGVTAAGPPVDWSLRTWSVQIFRDATWDAFSTPTAAEGNINAKIGALRDACIASWVPAAERFRSATRALARSLGR